MEGLEESQDEGREGLVQRDFLEDLYHMRTDSLPYTH